MVLELCANPELVSWSTQRLADELDLFRHDPPSYPLGLERQLIVVLKCIHLDPFDPDLCVRQIRDRCRISDNNVSSRFRYRLGLTIPSYIESLRLNAACHLLEATPVRVFDIALTVGYTHPQTFYCAFRRKLSCTPVAYRSKSRQR